MSTIITPSARLRPRLRKSIKDDSTPDLDLGATFQFLPYRVHPIHGASCLDLALYRPALGQVDLARLSVRRVEVSGPELEVAKRASALTEMMKARVGLVASDLGVESGIDVTWQLPSTKDGPEEDLPLVQVRAKDKKELTAQSLKQYVHVPTLTGTRLIGQEPSAYRDPDI